MFVKSTEGDYINIDHICRIYVEVITYKHLGDWKWSPEAKEKTIGYCVMCVTTENIKSDCFKPICLGYFEDLDYAHEWIDSEFMNYTAYHCEMLSDLIELGYKDDPKVIEEVFDYAEYEKLEV